MDCVIPGHSVRTFCASLSCLSRIGKDVYVEYSPIDGLKLRTLNDGKSVYCFFHYEPIFFERCTAPAQSRKRNLTSQDQRFTCRLSLRTMSAILRPRKDVASLRIKSETSSSALFLSFEFHVEKGQTLLRVVHRIKGADAEAVSAIATKEGASELVASPRILARLLDPLKRTNEIAIDFKKNAEVIIASSFHHTEGAENSGSNAVLQATNASLLKTETCLNVEEFNDYFYRDDREVEGEDAPVDVNDQVIVVFPVKEAKAMLQFCTQADELPVSLYFHWGGRPILLEASTESFTVQTVLATLDHSKLVSSSDTASAAAGGGAADGAN